MRAARTATPRACMPSVPSGRWGPCHSIGPPGTNATGVFSRAAMTSSGVINSYSTLVSTLDSFHGFFKHRYAVHDQVLDFRGIVITSIDHGEQAPVVDDRGLMADRQDVVDVVADNLERSHCS